MRTEQITKTYAKFHELTDEQKGKAIEQFDQYGWLYEFNMQERIDTLKALAKYMGGELDYSLSCVPDRGEFISIKNVNDEGIEAMLTDDLKSKDGLSLTGVCYDYDIIESIRKHGPTIEGLQDALDEYIDSIHDEYQAMLTEEYISDLCEANEYEFDLDTLELA